jgi:hypothetical protein
MQDGQCPPQLECTFEDPQLCGWKNIHGDNFDWTRANGKTASYNTGPSNDHTYGTNTGKVYLLSKIDGVFGIRGGSWRTCFKTLRHFGIVTVLNSTLICKFQSLE